MPKPRCALPLPSVTWIQGVIWTTLGKMPKVHESHMISSERREKPTQVNGPLSPVPLRYGLVPCRRPCLRITLVLLEGRRAIERRMQ
jgi:hypothetical protein